MKVLVVDDEHLVADTLGLVLKGQGLETTVAYSGEEALQIAKTFKPDALLTDVILTGMSGIDLAILTVESQPACKIVLCSGALATAELLRDAEARGYHFDILAKPILPQDLLDFILGSN